MPAHAAAVSGVKGAPAVQQAGEQTRSLPLARARDEYVREGKQEPSGRYWLGKDDSGQPKICFDDPEKGDAPAPAGEGRGGRTERCTCDTDQVDREIEKLRAKREELQQQIRTQTDSAEINELERKLAQTELELSQKDNDAYRRGHAVFS